MEANTFLFTLKSAMKKKQIVEMEVEKKIVKLN